jgi:L-threonylcarbamoyladenylate synthase
MKTSVLVVDPHVPQAEPIAQAAAMLRRSGLVSFPTETVYGLGANALDAVAVARIFAAKARPPHNPLIVHVAGLADVRQVAAAWPREAAELGERFWPGPLTLVLPRKGTVPDIVTAGGPTVAVRVPAHHVARALLQAAGVPIAAPSANRSSGLSPTRAEHVLQDLDGRIDLILDGGPCPGGIESTVLDLTGLPPRLLRPGLVSLAQLEAVIGPVQYGAMPAPGQALPSPGMLSRHYAPRTLLECIEGDSSARVEQLCDEGQRVGWVRQDREGSVPAAASLRRLPGDAASYAAELYRVLHELDRAGLDRIVVELPPNTAEWLAVRDRLRRASG